MITRNYLHEVAVDVVCKLVSDLSMVPKELFTKKIGPESVPYYQARFNLVVTVKSAMLITFHLEFNGKRYGSVTADYMQD